MNVYQRFIAKGDKTYYGRWVGPDPDRPGHRKAYLRNLSTSNRAKALVTLHSMAAAAEAKRFDALDLTKLRNDCAALAEVYKVYELRAECNPRTRKNNVSALRALLRGARMAWADKTDAELDALSVRELTLELVSDFQRNLVAAAGADNFKQDTARVTANSYFRQARSIFGLKVIAFYKDLNLPDLKPFVTARKLKEPEKKYVMPAAQLFANIRAQAIELRAKDANAYRGWLLCLGSGLRRKEAACARWNWIEPDPGHKGEYQIRLQTTEDFRTKSQKGRVVPLEAVAYAELCALRIPVVTQPGQPAAPDFILDGPFTERYRHTFDRLGAWMKACGWQRRKLAHELRKIFGSQVAAQAGLNAAQDLLGHSSPLTTKQYYVAEIELPRVKILSA